MTIELTHPARTVDTLADVATVNLPAAQLARALAVSKLGAASGILPITGAVSLTVTRDTLTLTTFDYTASTRVQVTAEGTTGSGTVAVHLAELVQVVKAAGKGHVALTLTAAGALTVSSGPLTSTLPAVDRAELPALPVLADAAHLFTTTTTALQAAAVNLARSASTDRMLPIICGVGITRHRDVVTLSATDRYRLTETTFASWAPDTATVPTTWIVPARELANTSKTLTAFAGKTATVTVRAGKLEGSHTTLTSIETAGATVTLHNVDGEFPRVSGLFPVTEHWANLEARAVIDAATTLRKAQGRNAALRAVLDRERSYLVLSATDGVLSIDVSANTDDDDTSPADWGFNPSYLADAFATFAGSGTVKLTWAGPGKPVVVTDGGDTRVLLMPVRIP